MTRQTNVVQPWDGSLGNGYAMEFLPLLLRLHKTKGIGFRNFVINNYIGCNPIFVD